MSKTYNKAIIEFLDQCEVDDLLQVKKEAFKSGWKARAAVTRTEQIELLIDYLENKAKISVSPYLIQELKETFL